MGVKRGFLYATQAWELSLIQVCKKKPARSVLSPQTSVEDGAGSPFIFFTELPRKWEHFPCIDNYCVTMELFWWHSCSLIHWKHIFSLYKLIKKGKQFAHYPHIRCGVIAWISSLFLILYEFKLVFFLHTSQTYLTQLSEISSCKIKSTQKYQQYRWLLVLFLVSLSLGNLYFNILTSVLIFSKDQSWVFLFT